MWEVRLIWLPLGRRLQIDGVAGTEALDSGPGEVGRAGSGELCEVGLVFPAVGSLWRALRGESGSREACVAPWVGLVAGDRCWADAFRMCLGGRAHRTWV